MTICSYCPLLCEFTENEPPDCALRNRCCRKHTIANRDVIPSIDGQPATLDAAIAMANRLLASSKKRLITGRIRSVEASRAVLAIASRIGAFVDPSKSEDAFKSIHAVQRSGMISASMSEVRFRSDCVVLVGDDRLLKSYPRLSHVLLVRPESRLLASPRRVIAMGKWSAESIGLLRSSGSEVCSIEIDIDRIPQSLFQWSRCSSDARNATDNRVSHWMTEARYLSVVWSAVQLNMPHADLWIERLYEWIADRNIQSRCVGFPLASDYVTFQQVCTWTTGFPGRVTIEGNAFEYDPSASRGMHSVATDDTFVSLQMDESLCDSADVVTRDSPTILIAPEIDVTTQTPRVFIPCLVSGIDHNATFFRVDGTVAVEIHENASSPEKLRPLSAAGILSRLGVTAKC